MTHEELTKHIDKDWLAEAFEKRMDGTSAFLEEYKKLFHKKSLKDTTNSLKDLE